MIWVSSALEPTHAHLASFAPPAQLNATFLLGLSRGWRESPQLALKVEPTPVGRMPSPSAFFPCMTPDRK